jgi:hypothetical protein
MINDVDRGKIETPDEKKGYVPPKPDQDRPSKDQGNTPSPKADPKKAAK